MGSFRLYHVIDICNVPFERDFDGRSIDVTHMLSEIDTSACWAHVIRMRSLQSLQIHACLEQLSQYGKSHSTALMLNPGLASMLAISTT